jgi:biopolymer transport protein ExbB/TolQ
MPASSFRDALRAVSGALEIPVVAALLLLMAFTVVLLGTLAAEVFTRRRKLPAIRDKLLAQVNDCESGRRETLALRLVRAERARCEGVVKLSDAITKLGPMFGLLGTLIPLGPGIIALGRGDTLTLSQSLLTAFDTTVAGLISAAAAFVVSGVRKRWYQGHIMALEARMEELLDERE